MRSAMLFNGRVFGANLCASTFEVEMPSKVVPDFTALRNRVVPRPLKEAHSYCEVQI